MITENSINIFFIFSIYYIIIIPILVLFNYYVIRDSIYKKIDNNHKIIKYIRILKNVKDNIKENIINYDCIINKNDIYIKKNLLFYGISVFVILVSNLILSFKYKNYYLNIFKKFNFIKYGFSLILDILLTFFYMFILSNFILYGYYNHLINKYKIVDL